MKRLCLIGCAAVVLGGADADRLTHARARAFLQQQLTFWSRGDFASFYAIPAPEAVFASEYAKADGQVVTKRNDKTADRRQAETIFSHIKSFSEVDTVQRIDLTADGNTAHVVSLENAHFLRDGQEQRLCARSEQTLVLRQGRIWSLG